MASREWTQQRLEQMIAEQETEGQYLEYKGRGSLDKTDGKRKEITKDVSAMVNADGGVLIYGMARFQDEARKHLTERIDPVDSNQYSREWLEDVVNSIRPQIQGIEIHTVPIGGSTTNVVYVIEIPAGETAHQATDQRYYQRHITSNDPMYDFQIRELMGRIKHPKIELNFAFTYLGNGGPHNERWGLRVFLRNTGNVLAHYVVALLEIPLLFAEYEKTGSTELTKKIARDNTVGIKPHLLYSPILPSLTIESNLVDLTHYVGQVFDQEYTIQWTVHADNAPPKTGVTRFCDIQVFR